MNKISCYDRVAFAPNASNTIAPVDESIGLLTGHKISASRQFWVLMKHLITADIATAALLLMLTLFVALPSVAIAQSLPPDLRQEGAIAALRANSKDSKGKPMLIEKATYNLGATGLRGWIYIAGNDAGQQGVITAPSKQILVTVVEAPGSAVLAVNDLILGAAAATSGEVAEFNSDCRKALGAAIGEAEKTGAGSLRVKRWRAGVISYVNIAMTIMDNYTATGPYSCPKSEKIFANARTHFVSQLLADPNFLSKNYGGAIDALALLASVAPGDADYAAVQVRLQTFARSLAPADLSLKGCATWQWSYIGLFLSEYYLRSVADGVPDSSVLAGINKYTVALAKGQGKYGTYNAGGAEEQVDGSLHGSIPYYGPINAAGIPANIAIVMGRKVLASTGGAVDGEIDPAIIRGSNFFSWYVNKGPIPYGEQEPYLIGHASNGKDPMCAVLFGLQASRPLEAEYYARMSVAGCTGREYGHTGQGLSYLWGAMGANVGGETAIAKYMENFRWHTDLMRRTDGSFTYHGRDEYGAGETVDGTYLGATGYNDISPTACYLLSYAVSLKRLYITGRDAFPANTLSAAKVANAIAAATIKQDVAGYTIPQLMTALGEYDPVVRFEVATELAKRPLTTEVDALIALITNGTMSSNANVRMCASETLGLRKTSGALAALTQRLSDPDQWVRGKAATALEKFGDQASPQLVPMLTAFAANAKDPNLIVWEDPLQIANSYLAETLFKTLAGFTIKAPKNILHEGVRAGLQQPSGKARGFLSEFVENRLTLEDMKAMAPSIIQVAAERSPADRMFADGIRISTIKALAKFKIEEGIPLCVQFKEQTWHSGDWFPFDLLRNNYRGAARDVLPTLYKWKAHLPLFAADGSISSVENRLEGLTANINSTITAIENAGPPPALNYFKTLTATATPAAITLPAAITTLTATVSDIDGGVQNVIWSKVSGPGAVTFSSIGLTTNLGSSAKFSLPGTYVLRARSVDRSILNYNRWTTFSSGYFDFKTYDEVLGAAIQDVIVTVSADPNRAPVSQNRNLTSTLNSVVPVTLTATDADGDTLAYTVITGPLLGELTGISPNMVFTPLDGYTGLESFTFKANDGKLDSGVATVTINVGKMDNRHPVAVNQAVTTLEETAKPITLVGTDADGNPLTYSVVTQPTRGILVGTAPNLTYLPAGNYPTDNFNGSDSFTFTVRDASLATSAVATVDITIAPVNDVPQATAQTISAAVGVAKPITLSGTDAEVYPLSYTVVTYPTHGTLSGIAPNLTYLAAVNYRGVDSFSFKAVDSEGALSASATVSITVANDPPVANPQDVKTQINTDLAITLSGTDSTKDALMFNMLTSPANGYLSGDAPNLTYTPKSDFTGSDSFTFKVNDGTQDSAVAIISIRVAQIQTWTNIAPGPWSDAVNWSGGTNPNAGGNNTGTLEFNTATYAGISSNDLLGSFLLNRVNFGRVLPEMMVSGNELSFVQNTSTLPEITQNSQKSVTLFNDLTLAADTMISGSAGGLLTLSGIISGAGSLTKASSGSLAVIGANTYSGGTFIDRGTFTLGNQKACGNGAITLGAGSTFQQDNFEGNTAGSALPNAFVLSGIGGVKMNMPHAYKDIWLGGVVSGSGSLIVQGGDRALTLTASNTFSGGITLRNFSNRIVIANLSALGSGTFRSEVASATSGCLVTASDLSLDGGVTNAFDISNHAYLRVHTDANKHLLLSGPITSADGIGHFHKSGSATLSLSGVNTYTGSTTVTAGILACNSASSLASGPLVITGTAKVNLDFTGTSQVRSLSLGGVSKVSGTYGSTFSPATYKDDTWFSGTGVVRVAPVATATELSLTASSSLPHSDASLTFTATVNGRNPTGNVLFYDGTTLLNTIVLNSAFQASFTTILTPGSHNITAEYAGDTTHGASTSPAFTTQALVAPTPPLSLLARLGSNSVFLTWNAVSQATDYRVKRSLTSSGPYTTIDVAYGTAFTDASAVDGIIYYYVVSATNASGESVNSLSVSAKPYTPSSGKNILDFSFPGLPATIMSGTNIAVKVPFETPLTGLSPAYTISPLATGSPVSGTARDFTSPQIYTIKAEDTTTKTYSVTVTVNKPPVAAVQAIGLGINTSKPITLAATDADGDVLDYTIVTSPLNGTLAGTEPNVVYTPASNYSGVDSFTFKANDGINDSAVVRVSLTVTPLAFTWNSAINGDWSDGSKWTVGTSPSSVGLEGYELNFNAPGAYTATHNLEAGFLLNRLNFGGSTVVLAGNSLALTAAGSNLPQVNQNSASAVTVSTPLSLAANATIGGSGTGEIMLSGIISGGGSLTKTSSGNLTLSGVNIYTGGTTVSRGMLSLDNKNGLGKGPLTMVAGTSFQQLGFEGNFPIGALSNSVVLSGVGNVIMKMSFGGGSKDIWLSQPISGTGGFTVEGSGRSLTLAANNTFSGGIKLTNTDNSIKIAHNNALGSGTFRTERTSAATGRLVATANLSAPPGMPNIFQIAAGAYLNVFADMGNHLLLTGPITSADGIGHLHKSGSATLTLTGVNTYTGTTTISAGILACNSATALGQGPVAITGGKLHLNYPGTRQVASLSLGGVLQANGSYGSPSSPAAFANDTYFSGIGTVIVGPINTTITVSSSLNPAAAGAAVTFTATVGGRTPTGNVSFYAGNMLLGTSVLNSSFQASLTTTSLAIGASCITASYAGGTNNSASSSTPFDLQVITSAFDTWVSDSAQGMAADVNRGAMDDPDKDGIPNVVEFVLGSAPMISSQAPLPTLTKSANQLVFTYNRSKAALNSISQTVEYGNNLVGWTPVIITPHSSGSVVITAGELSDRVTVTVPNEGRQTFIRLKVTK